MNVSIKLLPADGGDCIILRFKSDKNQYHNIIIDGGLKRTYHKYLKKEITNIIAKQEVIDLLVVTHIDRDHIGGILAFYEDESIDKSLVKNVWFNSKSIAQNFLSSEFKETVDVYLSNKGNNGEITFAEGEKFEDALQKNSNCNYSPILAGQNIAFYNAEISILSPTKDGLKNLLTEWEKNRKELIEGLEVRSYQNDYNETISNLVSGKEVSDYSKANSSSIAFLFKIDSVVSILFTGDAKSSIIIDSLKKNGFSHDNKLKVDYWKLSHHGSKKSTNSKLINLITCNNFFISTNGEYYNLPNKATLARIINDKKKCVCNKFSNFYFNYNTEKLKSIFSEAEKFEYNINCQFPKSSLGIEIEI